MNLNTVLQSEVKSVFFSINSNIFLKISSYWHLNIFQVEVQVEKNLRLVKKLHQIFIG